MAIERQRLYTLVRDPITEKKPGRDGGDQIQGGTRPFIAWMEAVNEALLDLLFENAFVIDDAYLQENGILQPDGSYLLNDLLIDGADVLRFTNSVLVTITGIIASRPSQQVLVISAGFGQVDLANESSFSLTENQFLTGVRATISLAPNVGYARFYYDGTDLKWRTITHQQGAAITYPAVFDPTFYRADAVGAGHAGGGSTWTVDVSQRLTQAYYLNGSLCYITLRLLGTSVAPTAERLRLELPKLYVAKKHITGVIFVRTNPGGVGYPALLQVRESDYEMSIELFNQEGGGFNTPVDVLGQFSMEIGSGTDVREPGSPPVPTTGPGSGGGPIPGGVALPNALSTIQSVANSNPIMLQESCQGQGGNWNFMDTVISTLRASDPRWGYNGKRGNVNDLSEDAISYYWGPGSPSTGDNRVYVIDIISGHCGPNPQPSFQDVTDYSGATLGAFVFPR